jgi:hypothetical protein
MASGACLLPDMMQRENADVRSSDRCLPVRILMVHSAGTLPFDSRGTTFYFLKPKRLENLQGRTCASLEGFLKHSFK